MISTVFRGADYPATDRFDQFCEMNTKNLLSMRLSTEDPKAFDGDIRAVDLGVVEVADLQYAPLMVRREPVYVRGALSERPPHHARSGGAVASAGSEHRVARSPGTRKVQCAGPSAASADRILADVLGHPAVQLGASLHGQAQESVEAHDPTLLD